MPAGPPDERDEQPHPAAAVEEWVFTCWEPDGSAGLLSGYRIDRARRDAGWYWAALVGADRPLLHVAEWSVPARADPFLVKAPGLWAEHTCDAPMHQWTVANETYATALDDADDALGRAYGVPDGGRVRPRVVRDRAGRPPCRTATRRTASCTASSSWPVGRCT